MVTTRLGRAMEMRQQQQTRAEMLFGMGTELAQFVASRHVEWLEWVALALGLNWIRTLANEAAFDSNRAYSTMAELTRNWPGAGGNPQGPWVTAIASICALFGVAYLLVAVSRLTEGPIAWADSPLLTASLRLRVLGLCLLIGWFALVAIMLHRSSPIGVGWGSHAIAAVATLVASMRVAGTHAHALLPDWLVRRWEGD